MHVVCFHFTPKINSVMPNFLASFYASDNTFVLDAVKTAITDKLSPHFQTTAATLAEQIIGFKESELRIFNRDEDVFKTPAITITAIVSNNTDLQPPISHTVIVENKIRKNISDICENFGKILSMRPEQISIVDVFATNFADSIMKQVNYQDIDGAEETKEQQPEEVSEEVSEEMLQILSSSTTASATMQTFSENYSGMIDNHGLYKVPDKVTKSTTPTDLRKWAARASMTTGIVTKNIATCETLKAAINYNNVESIPPEPTQQPFIGQRNRASTMLEAIAMSLTRNNINEMNQQILQVEEFNETCKINIIKTLDDRIKNTIRDSKKSPEMRLFATAKAATTKFIKYIKGYEGKLAKSKNVVETCDDLSIGLDIQLIEMTERTDMTEKQKKKAIKQKRREIFLNNDTKIEAQKKIVKYENLLKQKPENIPTSSSASSSEIISSMEQLRKQATTSPHESSFSRGGRRSSRSRRYKKTKTRRKRPLKKPRKRRTKKRLKH